MVGLILKLIEDITSIKIELKKIFLYFTNVGYPNIAV